MSSLRRSSGRRLFRGLGPLLRGLFWRFFIIVCGTDFDISHYLAEPFLPEFHELGKPDVVVPDSSVDPRDRRHCLHDYLFGTGRNGDLLLSPFQERRPEHYVPENVRVALLSTPTDGHPTHLFSVQRPLPVCGKEKAWRQFKKESVPDAVKPD